MPFFVSRLPRFFSACAHHDTERQYCPFYSISSVQNQTINCVLTPPRSLKPSVPAIKTICLRMPHAARGNAQLCMFQCTQEHRQPSCQPAAPFTSASRTLGALNKELLCCWAAVGTVFSMACSGCCLGASASSFTAGCPGSAALAAITSSSPCPTKMPNDVRRRRSATTQTFWAGPRCQAGTSAACALVKGLGGARAGGSDIESGAATHPSRDSWSASDDQSPSTAPGCRCGGRGA